MDGMPVSVSSRTSTSGVRFHQHPERQGLGDQAHSQWVLTAGRCLWPVSAVSEGSLPMSQSKRGGECGA